VPTKIFAAQATGCSPVTTAIKNGVDVIKPVKPNTIAKSIAIGNPADGYYGVKTANESGGYGEDISDEEIVKAMQLLAETEGIFTETAGGVTVGVTQKLIEQKRIKPDEVTVICITGNGLKTQEALAGCYPAPPIIEPHIDNFEEIFANSLTV
jgi:threonine synthase